MKMGSLGILPADHRQNPIFIVLWFFSGFSLLYGHFSQILSTIKAGVAVIRRFFFYESCRSTSGFGIPQGMFDW
jgi:cytochrome b subunit of formate dehydrogenase